MAAAPISAPNRPTSMLSSPSSNANRPVKSILRESFKPAKDGPIMRPENRAHLKRKLDDLDVGNDMGEPDEDEQTETTTLHQNKRIKIEEERDEAVEIAKRQKSVHFDMSLNVTAVMADVGGRTLEDTKAVVRRSLEEHRSGLNHSLDELQEVFTREHEPDNQSQEQLDDDELVRPEEMVLFVMALTSCTPLINKTCYELVKHILATSWMGRDEKFFRAYVQFLAALASSQGGYLRPVLDMIIEKFKEPKAASWTVQDFPPVDRETAQKRLHLCLRHMLDLFPAAKSIACELVAHKFPFPNETKSVYVSYLDNILRLRGYAKEIGPDLLEIITSEVVKLDTEFQLDLSDMDDELVARIMLDMNSRGKAAGSRRDGDGDLSDEEESDGDDDEVKEEDEEESDEEDDPVFGEPGYEEVSQLQKSTRLASKLDVSLDRLFALFAPVFEDPDSKAARNCLEDMLSDFANFVLTVPSSRHAQFLVFHFSQKSHMLQDLFTGTLLNLGFESNRPSAVRQAAAAYLSSYVARAARVPRDTVRNVANILCHRIDIFRRTNSECCRGPDLRRYQELYSWVQALLYIFCFRWRDLVDRYPEAMVDPEEPSTFIGQDLEWMPGLKSALTNIIYAPFNPLRVCSPPIVAEFAKLAHALRLMYVFPRIESNKSISLSQYASGHYGAGDALREDAGYTVEDDKWLQLEGNFPFDPYHLPISKRWLEGDYVSWTPIPGVSGGDEDDEEDSDDEGGAALQDDFEEDTATDPEEEDGF